MESKVKDHKRKQKSDQMNVQTRLSRIRKSARQSTKDQSKSKKQCGQDCKKHDFQLKPTGHSSLLTKGLTEPMAVNFCCKGNSTTIPIPMISTELSKEPQVPLFVLSEEVYRYRHYLQSHREQFQDAIKKANKMVDSDHQKQQLLVPIPKTKNCQICRVKIENELEYERHLCSIDHRMALKKSLGQKLILQETETFYNEKKIEALISDKEFQLKEISLILKETKNVLKSLLKKK